MDKKYTKGKELIDLLDQYMRLSGKTELTAKERTNLSGIESRLEEIQLTGKDVAKKVIPYAKEAIDELTAEIGILKEELKEVRKERNRINDEMLQQKIEMEDIYGDTLEEREKVIRELEFHIRYYKGDLVSLKAKLKEQEEENKRLKEPAENRQKKQDFYEIGDGLLIQNI